MMAEFDRIYQSNTLTQVLAVELHLPVTQGLLATILD